MPNTTSSKAASAGRVPSGNSAIRADRSAMFTCPVVAYV